MSSRVRSTARSGYGIWTPVSACLLTAVTRHSAPRFATSSVVVAGDAVGTVWFLDWPYARPQRQQSGNPRRARWQQPQHRSRARRSRVCQSALEPDTVSSRPVAYVRPVESCTRYGMTPGNRRACCDAAWLVRATSHANSCRSDPRPRSSCGGGGPAGWHSCRRPTHGCGGPGSGARQATGASRGACRSRAGRNLTARP